MTPAVMTFGIISLSDLTFEHLPWYRSPPDLGVWSVF